MAAPEGSPKKLFGDLLRHYRTQAGMSQDELGARVHCSGDLISKIENGDNWPTENFCTLCDGLPELNTNGALSVLREKLKKSVKARVIPVWFDKWPDAEEHATIIRTYEPLVLPGLYQTESYTRALLHGAQASAADDYIEQQVALRMERQEILSGEDAPHVWALIDEGVLHREIGSAELMYAQLMHLAKIAERPKTSVQIIPYAARERTGLLGAFAIAEHSEGTSLYLEAATAGQIVELPSLVHDAGLIFDTLRCEALPRVASLELIMKVAEERWKTT
jgi:DNA-binding XRE family transcriptional regulator